MHLYILIILFMLGLVSTVSAQNCGTGLGVCTNGNCCSFANWCGNSIEHCGIGCQPQFGICSNNGGDTTTTITQLPATSISTPAPTLQVVDHCVSPDMVAFTFDDGPYQFTQQIVDAFNAVGGKVTFFVNGLNWDCIYNRASALRSAFQSGHQIASHTWSHPDLTSLSPSQVQQEMNTLNAALRKIIGAVPVYMRPPYGSYNDQTITTLKGLGFRKLVMWDIDTGDSIGASLNQQRNSLTSSSTNQGHIILMHETSATTAQELVPFAIDWAKSRGLRMVTVGECLGDPAGNWYTDYTTPESPNDSWTC